MSLMKTFVALCFSLGLCSSVLAIDIVKWPKAKDSRDPRSVYKREMIVEALEKTIPQWGPYRLESRLIPGLNNARATEVIKDAEQLNVYVALTNPKWETAATPIRIPLRRGILNYRLFMIHRDNVDKFANVHSIDDLKRIKVGLRRGWSTTTIMKAAGFNVVVGKKYDGMFMMLDGGRFDYIPRGVNEIFNEQEKFSGALDLVVEPTLALYLPAPTYIFVSKKEPQLAERIEAGLEIMVRDGSLKHRFQQAYGEWLTRAHLSSRRIIKTDNPFLGVETPFARKELWFNAREVMQ